MEATGEGYLVRTSALLKLGVSNTCARLLHTLAMVDYLAEVASGYLARDPAEGYSLAELRDLY